MSRFKVDASLLILFVMLAVLRIWGIVNIFVAGSKCGRYAYRTNFTLVSVHFVVTGKHRSGRETRTHVEFPCNDCQPPLAGSVAAGFSHSIHVEDRTRHFTNCFAGLHLAAWSGAVLLRQCGDI